MRALVTGATGFIGRHVVAHLLEKNHEVVAMGRSVSKLSEIPWSSSVRFITHDLHGPIGEVLSRCGSIDVVVHLAWQGLPDCRSGFHVEENLPATSRFLRSFHMDRRRILCANRCKRSSKWCRLLCSGCAFSICTAPGNTPTVC